MYKKLGGLKILLGFLLMGSIGYAQNNTKTEAAKVSFTFDTKEYNYGDIPENGGLAEHTFVITNTGKTPLVITQVVSSCGCTTPDWTREPIAPQKSGFVKTAYDPKGRKAPFDKDITVYIDRAEPVILKIRGNVVEGGGNELPVFTALETEYEFGNIGENSGYAEHVFKFKNTGTAPLVVTQVTASCGCTKPDWTTSPVMPGQEGVIILAFNPKGRPGYFNKNATVYTNEDNGYKRYSLKITGTVVDRPTDPPVSYVDTTGGLGVQFKNLIYDHFSQTQENKKYIYLKNYNLGTIYLSWENVPEHITVTCPDSLKGEWSSEMTVSMDGAKTLEKRGRITDNLLLSIKDSVGKVLGKETFSVTANYLDDFKQLSPLESVNAPRLDIENTIVDFEKIRKNTTKEIVLTNVGKSDLTIHSFTSEDKRLLFQMKKKTIPAGASLTVKASIKVKDIPTSGINTNIYIVCNDPRGPVRMIKVTAQKEK